MTFSGKIYWGTSDQMSLQVWDSTTGQVTTQIMTTSNPNWPINPDDTRGVRPYYPGGMVSLPDGRVAVRVDQAYVNGAAFTILLNSDLSDTGVRWGEDYGLTYDPNQIEAKYGGGCLDTATGTVWMSYHHYDVAGDTTSLRSWNRYGLDGTRLEGTGWPGSYTNTNGTVDVADVVEGDDGCFQLVNGILYRSANAYSEFHRVVLSGTGQFEYTAPRVNVTANNPNGDPWSHAYIGTHPTYEHLFYTWDNGTYGPVNERIEAFADADLHWHMSGDFGNTTIDVAPAPTHTWTLGDAIDGITPASILAGGTQQIILDGDLIYYGITEPSTEYTDVYSTGANTGYSRAIVSLDLTTGSRTRAVRIPYAYYLNDGTVDTSMDPYSNPNIYGTLDGEPTFITLAPSVAAIDANLRDNRRFFVA